MAAQHQTIILTEMIFLHDPQDHAINIRENEEKYRQATSEIHFQRETHTMYTTVFCQARIHFY